MGGYRGGTCCDCRDERLASPATLDSLVPASSRGRLFKIRQEKERYNVIVKDKRLLERLHREATACEFCMTGYPVEVHHIKPRGIGGGSRLDVPFNLVMLCPECHDQAQRYKIMPSVFYALAAEREVRRLARADKTGDWWEV